MVINYIDKEIGDISVHLLRNIKTVKMGINSRGELCLKLPIVYANHIKEIIETNRAEFMKHKQRLSEYRESRCLSQNTTINFCSGLIEYVESDEVDRDTVSRKCAERQLITIGALIPELQNTPIATKEVDWVKWQIACGVGADINDESLQQIMRKFTKEIFIMHARGILPLILDHVASIRNLNYRSLEIGYAKTRWGSCTSNKDLRLSASLLLLPIDLIIYIITHELCHTIEMNHSERFYKLMEQFYPNMSELEMKLKKCEKELMFKNLM